MREVVKNLAIVDDGSGTQTQMLLPGILTLTTCGTVGYHYGTSHSYDHSMLHFLSVLMVQMLPLVLLKFKMYKCGDRLSLLPRTLVKTLLMHTVLSICRLLPPLMQARQHPRGLSGLSSDVQVWLDVVALVGAVYILRQVCHYQFRWQMFTEEREVRNLVLMAAVAAMITETLVDGVLPRDFSVSELTRNFIEDMAPTRKYIFTIANYIDVLAFMPVVLKLYEIESKDESSEGMAQDQADTKNMVLGFFGFVIAFYSWDDLIDPIRSGEYDIAMMAHAAHFVLLLDFACFFIFQVWTPPSAKGEHMQGLLEQGFDEDD